MRGRDRPPWDRRPPREGPICLCCQPLGGRHVLKLDHAGHPAVGCIELHLVFLEKPHRLALVGLKTASAVTAAADEERLAIVLPLRDSQLGKRGQNQLSDGSDQVCVRHVDNQWAESGEKHRRSSIPRCHLAQESPCTAVDQTRQSLPSARFDTPPSPTAAKPEDPPQLHQIAKWHFRRITLPQTPMPDRNDSAPRPHPIHPLAAPAWRIRLKHEGQLPSTASAQHRACRANHQPTTAGRIRPCPKRTLCPI